MNVAVAICRWKYLFPISTKDTGSLKFAINLDGPIGLDNYCYVALARSRPGRSRKQHLQIPEELWRSIRIELRDSLPHCATTIFGQVRAIWLDATGSKFSKNPSVGMMTRSARRYDRELLALPLVREENVKNLICAIFL